MSEKINNQSSNERLSSKELIEAAGDRLKNQERSGEVFNETEQKQSAEKARNDAEKLALSHEQDKNLEKGGQEPAGSSPRRITRKVKAVQYKQTMKEVQEELSAPSRAFSKIIHNKAVERASDLTGKTIARPNAILAGSLTACILVAAVYILAKLIGFRLSGFETIAAFTVGWIIGILLDIVRVSFKRRSF